MLRRRSRTKQARELARLLATLDSLGAERRAGAPRRRIRTSLARPA